MTGRRPSRSRAMAASIVLFAVATGCVSTAGSGATGAGHDADTPVTTPAGGAAGGQEPDVVVLHDAAVGLAHPSGLPGDPWADQATRLIVAFTAQRAALDGATSPPARRLHRALGDYVGLARQVETAAGSSSRELRGSFAGDIAAADEAWRSAVTAIGDDAGVDLLVNLPPLLLPGQPAVTVPPPPG